MCSPLSVKTLTEASTLPWYISCRSKFTRARVPKEVYEERSKEHEKYGGDPEQPHKMHVVIQVKNVKGKPYWDKDFMKHLNLKYRYVPVIHKNNPTVNAQLKRVKHLISVKPLRLPHGLPSEEEMADSYLNSRGELIVRRVLKPVDAKPIGE